MKKEVYNAYINILKEELVPAMGCTEPSAVLPTTACAQRMMRL